MTIINKKKEMKRMKRIFETGAMTGLAPLPGITGLAPLLAKAALALVLMMPAACTPNADIEPETPQAAMTSICASAALPDASGSGSVTRNSSTTRALGSGLSNMTLYYPTADGSPYTVENGMGRYSIADNAVTMTTSDAFSFVTTDGVHTNSGSSGSTTKPLYWQQVAGSGLVAKTFYLIVKQEDTSTSDAIKSKLAEIADGMGGGAGYSFTPNVEIDFNHTLWASTTTTAATNSDAQRPVIAFGTTKSRMARLTLIVKCADGLNRGLLSASVSTLAADSEEAANALSTNGNNVTAGIFRQAWPTTGSLMETKLIDNISNDDNVYQVFASSHLIAPQALPAANAGTSDTDNPQLLTISYNQEGMMGGENTAIDKDPTLPSAVWTLDLSKVSVKRASGSTFATAPATATPTATSGYAYGTTFGYNPGEHITLIITVSVKGLIPGADGIEKTIEDYETVTITPEINVAPETTN